MKKEAHSNTPSPNDTAKSISRSEVLHHCTQHDCWVIVRNGVYDLTPFVKKHPGGKHIILSRAGGDATSFFTVRHGHSPDRTTMLERFRIGSLPINERLDERALNEPFIHELTARCEAEGLYRVGLRQWFVFGAVRSAAILVFFTAMYLAFFTHLGIGWSILLVVVQAFIGTSLFGLIAHEHTHRSYPKNALLRALLRVSWPLFWPFISQEPLRYEHNSHHVKVGDVEFDFEVAAFAPLIRYSGSVPHRSIHRYQHLVARYLYPFYANIITTVGGIVSGFWERHNRPVALEHSLSLLMTFACFIIIPHLWAGTGAKALLMYTIYQCTLFYGVYVGAAINHFIPAVTNSIPERHANSYGYYICANTSNFAVRSHFWFWYTGGFNVQIEHHLVPFVPVENLRHMTPIVRELCHKYGYPYHEYKSFAALWHDHYSYLKTLSESDVTASVLSEISNRRGYQAR